MSLYISRSAQELQGDTAFQFRVHCEIDRAHPALTDELEDAIVRDRLANHGVLAAERGEISPSWTRA